MQLLNRQKMKTFLIPIQEKRCRAVCIETTFNIWESFSLKSFRKTQTYWGEESRANLWCNSKCKVIVFAVPEVKGRPGIHWEATEAGLHQHHCREWMSRWSGNWTTTAIISPYVFTQLKTRHHTRETLGNVTRHCDVQNSKYVHLSIARAHLHQKNCTHGEVYNSDQLQKGQHGIHLSA